MTSTFLVRVDGGGQIGAGHFVRSGALAEQLTCGGGAVSIFTVFDGDWNAFGIRPDVLARLRLFHSPAEADRAFLDALTPGAAAIIDGYSVSAALLEAARVRAGRVVYVTELPDEQRGRFATDVLFPGGDLYAAGYRAKFSEAMRGARVWSSPADLPLREIVRQPRTADVQDGRGLVVTLGGSSAGRLARRLMAHIAGRIADEGITLLAPHSGDADALPAAGGERVRVISAPPIERYLSELADARYVLTAAGSTCWELLHLRRPFFPIVIAENQHELARGLCEQGMVASYFDALAHPIEELRIGPEDFRRNPAWPIEGASPLVASLLASSSEAAGC
ncbi:MAG TPA: hypothetical protein VEK57_02625 [Thermoanaerobaculia bacterium]|nr:hypothetical protein [Thermoanaerobaculia bacterium]